MAKFVRREERALLAEGELEGALCAKKGPGKVRPTEPASRASSAQLHPAGAAPSTPQSSSSVKAPAPQTPGWIWSATVAVGLLVLVVAVAGVKSWADLKFSQTRADELGQEVESVDDSVRRLEERIHLLRSNSELLERVAREELGVVRPEEVVVILP